VPLATHAVAEADWPTIYGIQPTGAVIVRPDGHIAWRGIRTDTHTDAPNQLRAALTTALAR
jgi:tetracenomycin A2 monooxygenase-dioxygenase